MTPIAAYAEPGSLPPSEALRLARLLALPPDEGTDDVALAQRITAGLPVRSVAALAALLGNAAVVGPVVPEATLRRIKKARKPLSREHSERLYELSRVVDAVGRAFHGDDERVRAFMTRPHPLLQGLSPLDLARSNSAGAEAVLNLVRRAEAGVAL